MSAEDHAALSKQSLDTVQEMEAALGANEDGMGRFFHDDFVWRGNYGCGTKRGLDRFVNGWQKPFRAAFTDRTYHTERFLADGEWVACFGYIDALHSGPFMGIEPTNKRVRVPYMDFWHVKDGKIADNPVSVDLASVLAQLGRDIFAGEGWEKYDEQATATEAGPATAHA